MGHECKGFRMVDYHIILASNSPRRKELLSGIDLEYDVMVLPGIDESYPADLDTGRIAEYIAAKKAEAYKSIIGEIGRAHV